MFVKEKEWTDLIDIITNMQEKLNILRSDVACNELIKIGNEMNCYRYERIPRFPELVDKVNLLLEHLGLEVKQINEVPAKKILVKKRIK